MLFPVTDRDHTAVVAFEKAALSCNLKLIFIMKAALVFILIWVVFSSILFWICQKFKGAHGKILFQLPVDKVQWFKMN